MKNNPVPVQFGSPASLLSLQRPRSVVGLPNQIWHVLFPPSPCGTSPVVPGAYQADFAGLSGLFPVSLRVLCPARRCNDAMPTEPPPLPGIPRIATLHQKKLPISHYLWINKPVSQKEKVGKKKLWFTRNHNFLDFFSKTTSCVIAVPLRVQVYPLSPANARFRIRDIS